MEREQEEISPASPATSPLDKTVAEPNQGWQQSRSASAKKRERKARKDIEAIEEEEKEAAIKAVEYKEREEARKTRREKEARDSKGRAETERKERADRKDREVSEKRIKEKKQKRDLVEMMEASFGSSDDNASDSDAGSRPGIGEEVNTPIKKKPQIGGLEGLQMGMIVRDSMKNARPKSEEEKYGGDGQMSYHIFKNNFKSAAREDILAASDIINEAAN